MSQITQAEAEEMINAYRAENPNAIKSFWLNKDVIDFIRSTNELNGIRVYPALSGTEGENMIIAPTCVIDPGPGNDDQGYFNYSEPNPPYSGNSIGSL